MLNSVRQLFATRDYILNRENKLALDSSMRLSFVDVINLESIQTVVGFIGMCFRVRSLRICQFFFSLRFGPKGFFSLVQERIAIDMDWHL